MALTIPVLVRQVRDLSSARYAAGMQVTYIAFDIKQNTLLESGKLEAIKTWLVGSKLGLEIDTEICNVTNWKTRLGLYDFCIFTNKNNSVMSVSQEVFYLGPIEEFAEFLPPLGSNIIVQCTLESLQTFDSMIKKLAATFTLWLELRVDDAHTQHTTCIKYGFYGLSLCAKDEIQVGMADVSHLAEILELLEVD